MAVAVYMEMVRFSRSGRFRLRRFLRLAALLASLSLTVLSRAEPGPAFSECLPDAAQPELDRAVKSCTILIQSALVSGERLAAAYKHRAAAYHKKLDYRRAIQDYDDAIRLAPDDTAALFARATAYQEQRHYGRALADLEAAALITPAPEIERAKAFLLFYVGRMTQSAESFERYLEKRPGDGAAVLFRYLAEAKIGNTSAAGRELEADARKLPMRGWPSPVVDFHLGRIDEKGVFAAAEAGDPKQRNDRLCAANFHAAESRLFRAYLSGAIPLLRAALKGCPPELHEAHAAASELERLGQK